jgi:hypothetical protein
MLERCSLERLSVLEMHVLVFFLPTLLFFQRDCQFDPIFSGWLRAAAKMASVVTLTIEKP